MAEMLSLLLSMPVAESFGGEVRPQLQCQEDDINNTYRYGPYTIIIDIVTR